jgi:hypothetical protein
MLSLALGLTFGWPVMVGVGVFFVVVIGALADAVRALDRRGRGQGEGGAEADGTGEALAYRARASVFDHDSEKRFLGVLERALAVVYGPGARRVLVQVPLCRVVEVDRAAVGRDRRAWQRYWNKIDRKIVDYVVCDGATLKPLFAVELDGSSHDGARRRERDGFVENVLERAAVRLVRFDRRGREWGEKEVTERIAREGRSSLPSKGPATHSSMVS